MLAAHFKTVHSGSMTPKPKLGPWRHLSMMPRRATPICTWRGDWFAGATSCWVTDGRRGRGRRPATFAGSSSSAFAEPVAHWCGAQSLHCGTHTSLRADPR
jgi:hypothetical protein